MCAFLHDSIRYVEGATEVTTDAADAWEVKSGVCQDFAHLALGVLREARIPARYVSGYLHPSTDPVVGEEVTGESHAWIEWWDGEWVGFDPTNARPAGEQHVLVARGRDYEDVPPLRGIYSTRGDSELFVDVEITARMRYGRMVGRRTTPSPSPRRTARTSRRRTGTSASSTDASAPRGCCCRRCRSGSGTTSATTSRSTPSVRCCGTPSTAGSRTSTSPTTTDRRTARPRRTSAG